MSVKRHDRKRMGGTIARRRCRRPALSPRFLRSCWSPTGLVRFAIIFVATASAACPGYDPGDEENLNRLMETSGTDPECPDMVSPSLQPGSEFGPNVRRLASPQVRWQRRRKGERRPRTLNLRPSRRVRSRLARHIRKVSRRSVSTPAMSQALAMRSIGLIASRTTARPKPVTRAAASSMKVAAISTVRVCILLVSRLN